MKREHKKALRCFILEKLKETTCCQLGELAEKHDCQAFDMAEQFCIEIERIERFFCYPHYGDTQ
jgi:hypothetical protein